MIRTWELSSNCIIQLYRYSRGKTNMKMNLILFIPSFSPRSQALQVALLLYSNTSTKLKTILLECRSNKCVEYSWDAMLDILLHHSPSLYIVLGEVGWGGSRGRHIESPALNALDRLNKPTPEGRHRNRPSGRGRARGAGAPGLARPVSSSLVGFAGVVEMWPWSGFGPLCQIGGPSLVFLLLLFFYLSFLFYISIICI